MSLHNHMLGPHVTCASIALSIFWQKHLMREQWMNRENNLLYSCWRVYGDKAHLAYSLHIGLTEKFMLWWFCKVQKKGTVGCTCKTYRRILWILDTSVERKSSPLNTRQLWGIASSAQLMSGPDFTCPLLLCNSWEEQEVTEESGEHPS